MSSFQFAKKDLWKREKRGFNNIQDDLFRREAMMSGHTTVVKQSLVCNYVDKAKKYGIKQY
jgi:hypothetical protein